VFRTSSPFFPLQLREMCSLFKSVFAVGRITDKLNMKLDCLYIVAIAQPIRS